MFTRLKGRDLTQSYDKSPYINRNVKRAKWQHKQRHKKVWLHSDCGLTQDGQLGYSTSNLNFDNSILFYLANFLFYSILFCIFYSVFYSILLYNSLLNSILYSILWCIVFYSILFYLARYSILFFSILFHSVFYSVNSIMQNPKFCEYFLTPLILTFYWLICTL